MANLEEYQTAGKRIAIGEVNDRRTEQLERLIQEFADNGYNYVGEVGEIELSGPYTYSIQQHLFIKAENDGETII